MWSLVSIEQQTSRRPCDSTPQAGTPPGQVHPQAGIPPGRYTPQADTPPQTDTLPPGQVHPQAGTPLGKYTPWAGTHPPGRYTPPRQVHPPAGTSPRQVHSLGTYTPWACTLLLRQVHPLSGQVHPLPWAGTPPWSGRPPGQVHPSRSVSGQYASYWNAFLLMSMLILAGLAPIVNLKECITHTPPPSGNKAAQSGFETQRRHHKKS